MPKKSKTQNIDGKSYTFTQLAPRESLKVLVTLSKILGKPLATGIGAIDTKTIKESDSQSANIDMDKLADSIGDLFERIDEDKIADTIDLLLSCAMLKGEGPVSIEHHVFQGRTMHMLKVTAYALEVNYRDFLDASAGIGAVISRAGNMIRDRSTVTPQSGESG